jgi:hypothetical protein
MAPQPTKKGQVQLRFVDRRMAGPEISLGRRPGLRPGLTALACLQVLSKLHRHVKGRHTNAI